MHFLPALSSRIPLLAIVASLGICPLLVLAQSSTAAPKPGSAGGPPAILGAPTWAQLSAAQQRSLAPLAGTWNSLSDGQRRKWIALAQNYPSIAVADQQKLHSRMAEWAALTPIDREQARWNFAETKKVTPSNLAANWEAYQALSPEEKKKLAAGAQPKPAGAAVAIKPVAPAKLVEVPKVEKSMDAKRPLIAKPESLNRNTLLPNAEVPAQAPAPVSVTTQPDAPQD
jgi:hypothetical protein